MTETKAKRGAFRVAEHCPKWIHFAERQLFIKLILDILYFQTGNNEVYSNGNEEITTDCYD